MTFLSFLDVNKWTFLFYAALILVIYLFRKKFEWHGIVGLYRTKVGLKLMDRMGSKSRFFRVFGYVALVVGFAGMLLIVGMLGKGLYDLVFTPGAPPVVSPVLPGVTIPGVGIKVPLITGWIALFVVILIHEFSHGVVARAHDIPVTSSGLMVFGPIGGAFVEPEEKIMTKKSRVVQLSVFAAGPFSNIVASGVIVLLLTFLLAPLLGSFVAHNGVVFSQVQPGLPAAAAGVLPNVVYNGVNGVQVNTTDDFYASLKELKPGETVVLHSATGEAIEVLATQNPANASRGYLGVVPGMNYTEPSLAWLFIALNWITVLFTWVFILGLGIGLANLLPLGPVDGGRMFQVASERFLGKERGNKVWSRVTLLMIIVLGILLLVPFVIKPLLKLIGL